MAVEKADAQGGCDLLLPPGVSGSESTLMEELSECSPDSGENEDDKLPSFSHGQLSDKSEDAARRLSSLQSSRTTVDDSVSVLGGYWLS